VAHVQSLLTAASDGDTITLPVGKFSWTSGLDITKGITIKGATVISGPASNPAINDGTIIKDDIPRNDSIIKVTMTPSQSFRLTGVTFTYGTRTTYGSTNGAIHVHSTGSSPNTSSRIDHCHFDDIYQGKLIFISGWVYGVADHNVMECRSGTQSFQIWHDAYGGPGQYNGNGAWADFPWYGTNKFFFIEDNRIIGNGANGLSGITDSLYGGRYVVRHNYFQNAQPSSHGTEGGAARGQRCWEVYDNTFNWTIISPGAGQRSGGSLWHDNTYLGVELGGRYHTKLNVLRQTPARPHPVWGISDGTSVWDQNDTQGNGTYVERHPPYLFDNGNATRGITISGASATFKDSMKNWTRNQWVGSSIKNTNPASPCYSLGSYVISNTSNTITYYYYPYPDAAIHLIFNHGDAYQIHRVLTTMDQNGRGKGDQVTGETNPINSITGTPFWTHEALEPCMSWNNVHAPTGHALIYGTSAITLQGNRDYYNLGIGFPADSTPLGVSSIYTAAVNGVDYTGPFVYPHPLTSALDGGFRALVADFNGDDSPDLFLQSTSTYLTALCYLNNNIYVGSAWGPTLPPRWNLGSVADFNLDGHADLGLFSSLTRQTIIGYLSGPAVIGAAYGPPLPTGWELVGAGDFNGDSSPDYVLCKPSTYETAIWYLNNNVFVGGGFGPTLPNGWQLIAAADFNRDGHPDYLLFNSSNGDTAVGYLSDRTLIGAANGPTIPIGWKLVATADFNGDGYPDYLLYRGDTRETAIWCLHDNVYVSFAMGPILPRGWSVVAP
jgi:FG-GAP-like repeat